MVKVRSDVMVDAALLKGSKPKPPRHLLAACQYRSGVFQLSESRAGFFAPGTEPIYPSFLAFAALFIFPFLR